MTRRVVGTGLVATLGGIAATTCAAALARAAGVDFEISGGDETIPVSGIGFITGVFSLVGVAMAAAFQRWGARPAEWFVRTAVSLMAISLVPPLLVGADAVTAITLIALHLIAAAVMIPVLARSLRDRSVVVAQDRIPS